MTTPHTHNQSGSLALLLVSALALTGCPENGGGLPVSPVVQQAYLKAPNAESGDQFGQAVAISGDTLVVGAWREASNQTTISNSATASTDNSATNAGAAYVFTLQ